MSLKLNFQNRFGGSLWLVPAHLAVEWLMLLRASAMDAADVSEMFDRIPPSKVVYVNSYEG